MGLKTHGVDTRIGTDSAGEVLQRGQNVHIFLRVIDSNCSKRSSKLESLRESIYGDDPSSTQHEGTRDCELPNWPASPHGYRVSGLNLSIFCGHIACRKNI